MKTKNPVVSYIVLNWRMAEKTLEALQCIRSQSKVRIEIIVVDNESTAETSKSLQGHVDVLIINKTNLGFARACNQAAQVARGEFVAFINNDALLPRTWEVTGLDFLKTHPHAAALAGGEEINTLEHYSLSFVSPFTAMVRQSKAAQAEPVKVPYAYGSNLLVRRKEFLSVDGFEESYFAYYEDVDLGAKLASHNLESWYIPEMTILHKPGSSTGDQKRFFRNQLIQRNKYRLIARQFDHQIWWLIVTALYDVGKFIVGIIAAFAKPQNHSTRIAKVSVYTAQLRAAIWAILQMRSLAQLQNKNKHYDASFRTKLVAFRRLFS